MIGCHCHPISRRHRGATGVEYAFLMASVTAVVALGLTSLSRNLRGSFEQASTDHPAAPQAARPASAGTSGAGGTAGATAGPSAGAVVASTRSTLASDRFDAPSATAPSPWSLLGTPWQMHDGALLGLSSSSKNELRAFHNGTQSRDLTMSVTANLAKGPGFGLFFRISGEKINGYSFQYDPGVGGGQFALRKWVNGVEIAPPIASVKPAKGYAWYNQNRQVEVTAKGTQITVRIDGKIVLAAEDSTYASGKTGLRVRGKSEVRFDNFQVTTP